VDGTQHGEGGACDMKPGDWVRIQKPGTHPWHRVRTTDGQSAVTRCSRIVGPSRRYPHALIVKTMPVDLALACSTCAGMNRL
jgi:hypothetical protein